MVSNPEDFCDDAMLRGYRRNEQLIDLECIPEDVSNEILEQYSKEPADRSNLFNYFVKHNLKLLMENIQEF